MLPILWIPASRFPVQEACELIVVSHENVVCFEISLGKSDTMFKTTNLIRQLQSRLESFLRRKSVRGLRLKQEIVHFRLCLKRTHFVKRHSRAPDGRTQNRADSLPIG